MAAFDTPWTSPMNSESISRNADGNGGSGSGAAASITDPQPTVAAFTPNQSAAVEQRRSRGASVIVHQKTPLLMSTPPQVTRALAYSHPFVLPLNKLAGLLSWTTGDPWESFLFVACFWFITLYGDAALRYAAPVLLVALIILAMYHRRYSPLSSTAWTEGKNPKKEPGDKGRSQKERKSKSLDEILDCLQLFTSRCNILLEPFLQLVEFLSTQTTATAATTRPALTTLFVRILLFTPIWVLLSLPPLRIITTRRIILTVGTLSLSYHSRPARVSRAILWRSRTIRYLASLLTGLNFPSPSDDSPTFRSASLSASARLAAAKGIYTSKDGAKPSVRFTFTLYENQRRWIGLGWTSSLLSYERQAWTDEHFNECLEPSNFTLPSTDNETSKWRWVSGSEWRVEGAAINKEQSAKRIGGGGGGDESGWTYYDSKWRDGRKVDGWGRYTRQRKWFREAELVDVSESGKPADGASENAATAVEQDGMDADSVNSKEDNKKGWFRRRSQLPSGKKPVGSTNEDGKSFTSTAGSNDSRRSRDDPEDDHLIPDHFRRQEWGREVDEGLVEGLG